MKKLVNKDNKVRLNLYISQSGICSRRKADELIDDGVVQVNNQTVMEKGTKIDPTIDKVKIHGKIIQRNHKTITLAFNKPKGFLCSHTSESNKESIFKLLPKKYQNLKIGGRLDFNSIGLIILSDDGALIQEITHPSNKIEKKYSVKIHKLLDIEMCKRRFTKGIKDENEWLRAVDVELIDENKKEYLLTLKEGKNRQIKRMFEHLGAFVTYLERIQVGNLKLKKLRIPEGGFKEINREDIFS